MARAAMGSAGGPVRLPEGGVALSLSLPPPVLSLEKQSSPFLLPYITLLSTAGTGSQEISPPSRSGLVPVETFLRHLRTTSSEAPIEHRAPCAASHEDAPAAYIAVPQVMTTTDRSLE